MYNDEYLEHHGVLGMKWGIRRYQNKDGSLTSAGKKKYGTRTNFEKVQAAKRAADPKKTKAQKARAKANARTEAEILKYKKKAGLIKEEPKTKEAPKKQTIKDLSNEEIQARIERIRLENTLRELSPKKVSAGRKFVNALGDAATSAFKQTAPKLISKYLEDAFGLNDKSAYDQLKKEVDMLDLKVRKKDDIKKLKDEESDYDSLKKEVDLKELKVRQKTANDKLNKQTDSDYEDLQKEVNKLRLELSKNKMSKELENYKNQNTPTESSSSSKKKYPTTLTDYDRYKKYKIKKQ